MATARALPICVSGPVSRDSARRCRWPHDENQHLLALGDVDFLVGRIDRQTIRAISCVFGALDHAHGRLSPGSAAPERQDRLRELLRDDDLVVHVVVVDRRASSGRASSPVPRSPVAAASRPPAWRTPQSADGRLNSGRASLHASCRRSSAPGLPIMRDGAPAGALRMIRSGATLPPAVIDRRSRYGRRNSPPTARRSWDRGRRPVGLAIFVFGPLSTRFGATSPGRRRRTRDRVPMSLATNSSRRSGRRRCRSASSAASSGPG